jgi:hypothetical protein
MLYTEVITVCYDIYTKHKCAVWAERKSFEC